MVLKSLIVLVISFMFIFSLS